MTRQPPPEIIVAALVVDATTGSCARLAVALEDVHHVAVHPKDGEHRRRLQGLGLGRGAGVGLGTYEHG